MQHHSPGAVEARHGGQDVDVLHAGAVHLGHAQSSTWCRGGAGRAGGDRLSEEEEKEKRKHFSTLAITTRPGIFFARLRYEKGQRFFLFIFIFALFFHHRPAFCLRAGTQNKTKGVVCTAPQRCVVPVVTLCSLSSVQSLWLSPPFFLSFCLKPLHSRSALSTSVPMTTSPLLSPLLLLLLAPRPPPPTHHPWEK